MNSHQNSVCEFLSSHNMLEDYSNLLAVCQEREIYLGDLKDMEIEDLEVILLPEQQLTKLYLALQGLFTSKTQQLHDLLLESKLLGVFQSLLIRCAENNIGIPELLQNTAQKLSEMLNYESIKEIEALVPEIQGSLSSLRKFLQSRIDTSQTNYAKFLKECEADGISLDEIKTWTKKKFLEKKYLKMTEVNELYQLFSGNNPTKNSQSSTELRRSKTQLDELSTLSLGSKNYNRARSDLENSMDSVLFKRKASWLEESLDGKDTLKTFRILRLKGENKEISLDEEEFLEFISLIDGRVVTQKEKRKYAVDFGFLDSTVVRPVGIAGRSKLIDSYLVAEYQANLDQLCFMEHNLKEIGLYVLIIPEQDKTMTVLTILWPGSNDQLLDGINESQIYRDFTRVLRKLSADCFIFLNEGDSKTLAFIQPALEFQTCDMETLDMTLEVIRQNYALDLKTTSKNPIKEARICGVGQLVSLFTQSQIKGGFKEEEQKMILTKEGLTAILKEKASRANVIIDPKINEPVAIKLLIETLCPDLFPKLEIELKQHEDTEAEIKRQQKAELEEELVFQRKKILENYRKQQAIKVLKSQYKEVAEDIEKYLAIREDFHEISLDQWKKPELLTEGLINLDLKPEELTTAELDKYKKITLTPYEIAASTWALELKGINIAFDPAENAEKEAKKIVKALGGADMYEDEDLSFRDILGIRCSEILSENNVNVKLDNSPMIMVQSSKLFEDLMQLIAAAAFKKFDVHRASIDEFALKKLKIQSEANAWKIDSQFIYEKYFKEMLKELNEAPKKFENEIRIVQITPIHAGSSFSITFIHKEKALPEEEWNHFKLASSAELNPFPSQILTLQFEEDMRKTVLYPVEDDVLMMLSTSLHGGKTDISINNIKNGDLTDKSMPFETLISDYDPTQKLLALYHISIHGAQLLLYSVSLGRVEFTINLTEEYNIIGCQFLCFEYTHSALWVLDDTMNLRKIAFGKEREKSAGNVSMSLPKDTPFDCMTITSDGEFIMLLGAEGMLVYNTQSLQKVKHFSEIKGKSLQARCLRLKSEKGKHYQLFVLDSVNLRINSYQLKIESSLLKNNLYDGLKTSKKENFVKESDAGFEALLKEFLPREVGLLQNSKRQSVADKLYLIFSDRDEEESKSNHAGSNGRLNLTAYLRAAFSSTAMKGEELEEIMKRVIPKYNPNHTTFEELRTAGPQKPLGQWLERFLEFKSQQGLDKEALLFSARRPLLYFELQTKLSNSIVINGSQ